MTDLKDIFELPKFLVYAILFNPFLNVHQNSFLPFPTLLLIKHGLYLVR